MVPTAQARLPVFGARGLCGRRAAHDSCGSYIWQRHCSMIAGMMRAMLAGLVIAVLLIAPPADAESVAQACPEYVSELQRARVSLVGGDRTGAIAALREAQHALAECIRRESDSAGAPVLLAAASSL
jgi:hypothetical protein